EADSVEDRVSKAWKPTNFLTFYGPEDHIDESGESRTINLRFGSDVMSIWTPLREQLTDSPVAIPQSVFERLVERTFKANWKFQPKIFYSHLTERDSRVRGPLEHTEHPHGKMGEDTSEAPLFTIEIPLKDHPLDGARLISYELGQPLRQYHV
ncbi:hypothetical protein LTR02_016495, partial [Friedmanniomyces endolithicus]